MTTVAGDRPVDPAVSRALRDTADALRAATEAILRPRGLSLPQYSCLSVLTRSPGASGSEVARALGVTRQSVHVQLRILEHGGLLERGRAAGRALSWRVTPRGRERHDDAEAEVRRLDRAVLGVLDDAQQRQLRGLLETCVDGLERAPVGPPA